MDNNTHHTDSKPDHGIVPPAYIGHAGLSLQLLNASPNMICFYRDGIVEYVNDAAVKVMRAGTPENLIGRPFREFFDADFGALIADDMDAFSEDEAGTPLKTSTLSGEWLDMAMHVTRLDLGSAGAPMENVFVIECNDITQYIKTSELTRLREARVARILNSITEAIITTDGLGNIEDFNPAAEKSFGISKQQALGENVEILIPELERQEHRDQMARYLQTGESNIMGELREFEGVRADGARFPIEVTVSEIYEGQSQRKFIAVLRDITERRQRDERIEFLAHHDALTGLPNRHLFEDRLNHAINAHRRRRATMALMFIDLDKFKPINDTLGHEAGDIVLKAVAERLLERVRTSDTVARVGGDESVIILDDIDSAESAGNVAAGIIDILTNPIQAAGEECTVGESIGVAMFPDDANDASGLLACADQVMYRVKAAGRNSYLFYNPDAMKKT